MTRLGLEFDKPFEELLLKLMKEGKISEFRAHVKQDWFRRVEGSIEIEFQRK